MEKPIRKFLDYKYPIGAVVIGYFLIVLGLVSIIVFKKFVIGITSICIGTYFAFSYTGILIKKDKRTFKYYESRFGIKEGLWRSFTYYPHLSILTINKKTDTYGPNQIQILDRFKVYRIFLLNESHTQKFLLGEFRKKELAKKMADRFVNDLGLELVTYSPTLSESSMAKKR